MAFRFSLQRLLNLRLSLERQEEMKLQVAHQKVAALIIQIEEAQRHFEQRRRRRLVELQATLWGAELQVETLCDTNFMARLGQLTQELRCQEIVRDQQLSRYRHARQQREILESLSNEKRHAHEEQSQRREQRYLDDLFLVHRDFLRRG